MTKFDVLFAFTLVVFSVLNSMVAEAEVLSVVAECQLATPQVQRFEIWRAYESVIGSAAQYRHKLVFYAQNGAQQPSIDIVGNPNGTAFNTSDGKYVLRLVTFSSDGKICAGAMVAPGLSSSIQFRCSNVIRSGLLTPRG